MELRDKSPRFVNIGAQTTLYNDIGVFDQPTTPLSTTLQINCSQIRHLSIDFLVQFVIKCAQSVAIPLTRIHRHIYY